MRRSCRSLPGRPSIQRENVLGSVCNDWPKANERPRSRLSALGAVARQRHATDRLHLGCTPPLPRRQQRRECRYNPLSSDHAAHFSSENAALIGHLDGLGDGFPKTISPRKKSRYKSVRAGTASPGQFIVKCRPMKTHVKFEGTAYFSCGTAPCRKHAAASALADWPAFRAPNLNRLALRSSFIDDISHAWDRLDDRKGNPAGWRQEHIREEQAPFRMTRRVPSIDALRPSRDLDRVVAVFRCD